MKAKVDVAAARKAYLEAADTLTATNAGDESFAAVCGAEEDAYDAYVVACDEARKQGWE